MSIFLKLTADKCKSGQNASDILYVKSDKLIPKLIQNPKCLEIPTQLARKETVLEELIKSNTHKLKSFRECKDTILKKYSVGARTDK